MLHLEKQGWVSIQLLEITDMFQEHVQLSIVSVCVRNGSDTRHVDFLRRPCIIGFGSVLLDLSNELEILELRLWFFIEWSS